MLSIFLGVCDSNLKSVAFFVTQAKAKKRKLAKKNPSKIRKKRKFSVKKPLKSKDKKVGKNQKSVFMK